MKRYKDQRAVYGQGVSLIDDGLYTEGFSLLAGLVLENAPESSIFKDCA